MSYVRWILLGMALLTVACALPERAARFDPGDGSCARRADTPVIYGECALSVLTLNVHGLSPLLPGMGLSSNETSRSARIGWLVRDYDVILLQENFEFRDLISSGPEFLIDEVGTGPRFHWLLTPLEFLSFPIRLLRFRAPYGSGLSISSTAIAPAPSQKGTSQVIVREKLPDCHGWLEAKNDCFSTKGVLGVRMRMRNGAEIDVYTVHLDAGKGRKDRKTRKKQLKFIRELIQANSEGRALIVGGDFNIEFDDHGSACPGCDRAVLRDEFMEPLGLEDSGSRQPEPPDYWHHRVDYILYRGTEDVSVRVKQGFVGEDRRFRYSANRGRKREALAFGDELTDHPALYACFLIDNLDPGSDGTIAASAKPRRDEVVARHRTLRRLHVGSAPSRYCTTAPYEYIE